MAAGKLDLYFYLHLGASLVRADSLEFSSSLEYLILQYYDQSLFWGIPLQRMFLVKTF